jgi:hypothetical protein
MMKINIFGTGEKINILGEARINRLLSRPTISIGINAFPVYYPNVDYWLFTDSAFAERIIYTDIYKGQKIITCDHVYKSQLKGLDFNIGGIFEPNEYTAKTGNSGYYAIEWAIQQGFKKASLYGVMDSVDYEKDGLEITANHFYGTPSRIPAYKWDNFKKHIDSNFNGRIELSRPLLKYTDAQTKSEN